MQTLLFVLVVALALAGCRAEERPAAATARAAAPAVVVHTERGPVHLPSLQGSPVVLHFAEASDAAAWAALADAAADLEASGAVVLAVRTDGPDAPAAEAFGYEGRPLTVVVDGEGTVRGRVEPVSGDDVFALAAPVLAEADLAQTVSWPGARTLDALVASGGVVVDLGPGPASVPNALRLTPDALSLDALPADLGTPLAFVGETAADAARQATEWGYAAVFVAAPDGALTEVAPAPPPADGGRRQRDGVRG